MLLEEDYIPLSFPFQAMMDRYENEFAKVDKEDDPIFVEKRRERLHEITECVRKQLDILVHSEGPGKFIRFEFPMIARFHEIIERYCFHMKLHYCYTEGYRVKVVSKNPPFENFLGINNVPDPVIEFVIMNLIVNSDRSCDVILSFAKPISIGSPIEGYVGELVQFSSFSTPPEKLSKEERISHFQAKEEKLIFKGLEEQSVFKLRIKSKNETGESEWSKEFVFQTPSGMTGAIHCFGNLDFNQITPKFIDVTEEEFSEMPMEIFKERIYVNLKNDSSKFSSLVLGNNDIGAYDVDCNETCLAVFEDGRMVQWGKSFVEPEPQKESSEEKKRAEGAIIPDQEVGHGDDDPLDLNIPLVQGLEVLQSKPWIPLSKTRVIQVGVGNEYSMCLTMMGDVFTWGLNNFGQLGHGDTQPRSVPTKINFASSPGINSSSPIFVKSIACGGRHALALDINNKVYSWGQRQAIDGIPIKDRFGNVVNYANSMSDQKCPRLFSEVLGQHKILSIHAGDGHSAALSDEKRLFLWGANNKHQLGMMGGEKVIYQSISIPFETVCPVDESKEIESVSTGGNHTLVVIKNRETEKNEKEVYAMGDNRYGQCGPAKIYDYKPVWTKVPLPNFARVASAGFDCSICQLETKEGDVYFWGNAKRFGFKPSTPSPQCIDKIPGMVKFSTKRYNISYISESA